MGGYRDEVNQYLATLMETINSIKSKFEESDEPIDITLSGMLDGIMGELADTGKALDITDENTCARIAEVIGKMKARDFLSSYSEAIKKEEIPQEEAAKRAFWARRSSSIGNLFKGLQYFFDKLAQLSSGTPLTGIFTDLSKLFSWVGGAFGSRA